MMPGDKVRIRAGVANGRIGVVISVHGDRLKALADGIVTVCWSGVASLEHRPLRVREFRPWTPEPFRIPRPGSEVAAQLPSVLGGQKIYPRGLQP